VVTTAKKQRKASVWVRLGDVIIIGGLLYGSGHYIYAGASGFAFDLSRIDSGTSAAHDAAVIGGRVPFVADQLLYFPLAVTFLSLLALIYLHRSSRQTAIVVLSGAGAIALTCLVTLTVEIVWVASGVPYTNYSGAFSAWADPTRYVWPILALGLWLLAALAAGAFGGWGMRALFRSPRDARSVRSRSSRIS